MKFKEILHQLTENFDLKKNHILILNLLYNHDKLTADEIVEKTNIPKGGIYEYLNDLLRLKLVTKDNISPARFHLHNFKNKLLDFLHLKFDDFIRKEADLLSLIETSDSFDFSLIKSKEEYTFQLMDIVTNGKKCDFIVRHKSVPFELYPENEQDFIRFREILWKKRPTLSGAENPNLTLMQLKTFKEAWKQKKRMRYIITKSGFDYYFQTLKQDFKAKTVQDMIAEIHRKLKPNIQIKVTDEKTPYNLFLADHKLMFVVAHSTKLITGFVSTNKDIIEVYQNLFDSMFNPKVPIKPIKDYLKDIRK